MNNPRFFTPVRWLMPVIVGAAFLFSPVIDAQTPAPAPAPVPDYSGGVAKFLQLGLPDVKDAKYIHIENNYGFYDHDGLLGDSQLKLTGNAWLLKELGNGRVLVLVDSIKTIELVEAKIFEEEQKKKMEARMKALQKKEEDLEEGDIEDFMGMDERVQGGKWKEADLKKDLATVLAKLKDGKSADDFDYRFNSTMGKTFLFAAHAMQKGHKEEANAIIDALFKKSGDNRKVLSRAMSEMADGQYADIYNKFSKSGDWAAYLKGMDDLLGKFPAVWRDKPVVQKVADTVRKQMALAGPPELTGEGLTDEDRQLAKELAEYKDGLRANESSLNWLIATPRADANPKQKLDPLQRITARGVRSVPLLAALLKDNYLVRLKSGSMHSYSYYSSDEDEPMSEDDVNERYENYSRPRSRGDLARALLDDLVVKREDMFNADRMPTSEEIGKRVMEWYGKHKDKKPGELQRLFLAEGDEHVQQMAMWSLIQSKDDADRQAVEEHLLKPDKVAENLPKVVSYAQQQGSKAKPLVEKFLAKAKAQPSLVPASRLEHADDRYRKMMEKQAKDQLAVLENLMSDKKVSVLLDEYANSDRKWTQQEWNKVDDALWSKLREEDTDTAITLLLEASLKSKSDFLAWAFLQGVSQARYYSAMKNRDENSPRTVKPETLKIEKHAELWKKVLQHKRQAPASYRAYMGDVPTYAETAAGIMESIYAEPTDQMRTYQMSQTLGSKVFKVYLARAEARLAGKELPGFPDKSKVSEARKAEIKKQLENTPAASLVTTVAKYSMDEQLVLSDVVGGDAKLNEKLSPGTHIITEMVVPENRPDLKKLMESHKGKPLSRALVETMVAESQKLLPQRVTPMMVIRRSEPLAGLKVTIMEPDMSELGRYSYGGNRNQGTITAQLSCMDSDNRINGHAQWMVNLPEQAKAGADAKKKKGDDDDLLVEAGGAMSEHYAKTQEEFWKKLGELMEPKVNAFAPYQVMIMCMLPSREEDEE